MAEFDPQGPSDNEAKNQAEQAEDCCGGQCRSDKSYTDESFRSDPYRSDSFVADWSGAESKLAAQADAFEASNSEPRKTEQFWVELVQSQQVTPQATESTELARPEGAVGAQSQQFWADLVRSQQPTESDTPTFTSSSHSSLNKPTGMGWSDDEASEWAPPEREVQREYEPVQPAGEPVEAEASARRDDVEWSAPASESQDWASARSEGMSFEPSAETTSEQPSLMQAALDAAQSQPKAKKAKGEKKTAAKKAKKPAAKKKTATKKTAAKAKKSAKKPAAKKVVKKTPPAPTITPAPTRHAA
jgi:hypothetical protein